MKTGYVVLYTTNLGLQSFITTGNCTAKVHQGGTWHNQILVPRESIYKFELLNEDDLPLQVSVDVRNL